LAVPAAAQFGGLFNSPPRPPADVPNDSFPPRPPRDYPDSNQQPPAAAAPAAPASPAARPAPSIQAQPLPPPPGGNTAPPAPAANTPPQGQPAQASTARGTPAPANPPPPQPADTSPQSDDTVITETPTQHVENGRAVFSGLDKITGRIISFDAAIGETVQFGALQVTARACYTRPPTEATNTDAFVEVDEVTLKGEIKRIFTGWMFASSPGLHGVEHPIYDVWLTDCASPQNTQIAQPAAPPPPAAPVAAPAPARQQRQVPARQPSPAPISPAAPTAPR
jgi:hypothetical protein